MDTLLAPTTISEAAPAGAARPSQGQAALLWLERALLVVGAVALGYYAYVNVESFLYQRQEDQELDRILRSAPTEGLTASAAVVAAPMIGAAIGRIEIPRLGVSAVVIAGSDARTLSHAVGHISGTALPGAPGNVGLAGHRDTFFRRLQHVSVDDEVVMTTSHGVFRYRVSSTRVVQPTDVWVLDPTSSATLTLVTCYPFTYVGSAPQRFIVSATLIPTSLAPAGE